MPSNVLPLRPEPARSPKVVELPLFSTDRAIVEGIRSGDPEAGAALFDRYQPMVQRVLLRVLGPDPDVPDLLQDVFVAALGSINKLDNASALRGWLTQIAVFTARGRIRRRVRWRFLVLAESDDMPETEGFVPSAEVSQALRKVYALLDRLQADERIAFALRFIEGMELTEVAKVCNTSLATIKRRLQRGQRHFIALAKAEPCLAHWVREET